LLLTNKFFFEYFFGGVPRISLGHRTIFSIIPEHHPKKNRL